MAKKVDIKNFMGVLGATVQTPDGIEFSGEYMPSGIPVKSPGVTLDVLMADRSMAEQWWNSIVGQHEREKEQRNHAVRTGDTPDLVIRGQDGSTSELAGSSSAAKVGPAEAEEELQEAATLEEILERRIARETRLLDRLGAELEGLEDQAQASRDRLSKATAALTAVRNAE
jgi:hypothetical protein